MIKIYGDNQARSVFIEDANGAQFQNGLQAILSSGGNVSIVDLAKQVEIVSDSDYSLFVDENSTPYGSNIQEVINALNSVFVVSGGAAGELPVITSPTSINSVEGATINYELIANFGVGYEWDNLPVGLTTAEGNVRKIIGGSGLSAGTYTPTMHAINYNGEDVETLTITVSNPPFANTKSIRFNNNDYLYGLASFSNPLYRPSNGSGASDAWSIALWFKAGTSSNNEQTILMFGGSDQNNEGRVQLWYDGSGGEKNIKLRYGTNNNYLEFSTPNNGITQGVWSHIVVTYDGGTTGQSQGDLSDYYSRFKIFVNGASQSLSKNHNNYGWSGSINAEFFSLGKNGNAGNYLRNNCNLDEVALWSSDQSANVSLIYSGGTPSDLSQLASPPVSWWRMGDGDTYPFLDDSIGSSLFVMQNMTVADIVNDVP